MPILDKDGNQINFEHNSFIKGEISWADPLNIFPGGFRQFNPSDLVGKKGLKIFDEMRKDDQVKAALNLKKYSILAPDWEIVGGEERVRSFLEDNLNNMRDRFKGSLWEILSAMDFGYSVSEKIFEEKDGAVKLKDIKGRKPHTFEFRVDKFGNLLSLHQDMGTRRPLPPSKFVIYTFQKEFGNHYGRSDLEAAYPGWWAKTNTFKWMMMYLERFGIPPLFGFFNPDRFSESQINNLKDILQNMQAATSGLIPRHEEEDFQVESPNQAFVQTQTQRIFAPALDRQDQMIARALLMPGLIGLTPEGKSGSFARSQTSFGTFMIVIEHFQSETANVITEQINRPLVELNFGPNVEVPEFRWMPMTDEQKLGIAESWANLVDKGAVTPEATDQNHLRRLHQFPETDSEEPPPGPSPENGEEAPEGEENDETT